MGSGGKRVRMRAGSGKPSRCSRAKAGRPAQRRETYRPACRSDSTIDRTKFDAGLRYAIVSITGFGVLFLGILIALSHIRLDIGRPSMMMAALPGAASLATAYAIG